MIRNTNKKFRIALGKHIRKIRKSKGLGLEKTQFAAGFAKNQISRIENADVNVTVSTLYSLSKALKVPIVEIFNFEYSED